MRSDKLTDREQCRQWIVDCEECGLLSYFGPEPVLCPSCHSTTIEVARNDDTKREVSK